MCVVNVSPVHTVDLNELTLRGLSSSGQKCIKNINDFDNKCIETFLGDIFNKITDNQKKCIILVDEVDVQSILQYHE